MPRPTFTPAEIAYLDAHHAHDRARMALELATHHLDLERGISYARGADQPHHNTRRAANRRREELAALAHATMRPERAAHYAAMRDEEGPISPTT